MCYYMYRYSTLFQYHVHSMISIIPTLILGSNPSIQPWPLWFLLSSDVYWLRVILALPLGYHWGRQQVSSSVPLFDIRSRVTTSATSLDLFYCSHSQEATTP